MALLQRVLQTELQLERCVSSRFRAVWSVSSGTLEQQDLRPSSHAYSVAVILINCDANTLVLLAVSLVHPAADSATCPASGLTCARCQGLIEQLWVVRDVASSLRIALAGGLVPWPPESHGPLQRDWVCTSPTEQLNESRICAVDATLLFCGQLFNALVR